MSSAVKILFFQLGALLEQTMSAPFLDPSFAILAAKQNPDLAVLPTDCWVRILQFVDSGDESPEAVESLRAFVEFIVNDCTAQPPWLAETLP